MKLLSDHGANFLSKLLLPVCEALGVGKIITSGYHLQTDGLVERFNQTLISMLSKSSGAHPCDWDLHLPFVLYASLQSSTRVSFLPAR